MGIIQNAKCIYSQNLNVSFYSHFECTRVTRSLKVPSGESCGKEK